MTTATVEQTEYQALPLFASEAVPGTRNYGEHPVPIDPSLSPYELPVLQAQKVEGAPTGEHWKKWGRWRRDEASLAWHFYSADVKFESVLRDPFKLVETGAEFAVEVNVSSYGDDPLPLALAGLWRKRCISRIWQEQGVNVFVDLFVDGWARELVLDGVPSDHCLYATKYAKTDLNGEPLGMLGVLEDFSLAADHCSDPDNLIFAVYGGGQKVQQACKQANWLHLPTINTKAVAAASLAGEQDNG